MRILFRYDVGGKIGSGHQSRCELIANQAQAMGHTLLKAIRADKAGSLTGEPSFHIPRNEVATIARFLRDSPPIDWIILDHYGYTEVQISEIKSRLGVRVCVFDDHLSRLNADLRWAPFSTAQSPFTLTGESYAIVNPAFFQQAQADAPDAPGKPYNFICFGTADPKGLTRQCLAHISQQPKLLKHHWVVIAGKPIQEAQSLEKFNVYEQIHLFERIPIMQLSALIRHAEKAIVSCSTLAIESLACQANFVGFNYIDNQENIARWLTARGVPVFDEVSTLFSAFDSLPNTGAIQHQLDDKGPERLLTRMASFTE